MKMLLALSITFAPALATSARRTADDAELLVSADTRGAISGCASCPRDANRGPGLAERAGWAAARRAEHALVLVDAGDFLVGPETLASSGRVIVDAYDAMGYEAAHVTTADLWLGLDATLAALADARFALFSANLYGADGERLFAPVHITEVGGTSVALVGVSAPGAAIAGVTVRPVAASLVEIAGELDSLGVDRRVLFFHGSPGALAEVPRQLVASFDAVVAELPTRGAAMAALRFGEREVSTQVVRVAPDAPNAQNAPEDERVAQIIGEHVSPASLWDEDPEPAQLGAGDFDPSRPGKQDLWLSDKNRAMELLVVSAERADSLNDVPAPAGRTWLAIDTEWENTLAGELVRELDYSETVHIASIARQVFLVVDGVVVRAEVERAEQLGARARSIRLSERGEFVAARIVFPIPAATPRSIELCAYPDQFEALHVALLDAPVESPNAAAEPLARASNDEIRVELLGLERLDEWAGQPAREGRELIAVDIAATSEITLEADALALDPEADAQARARLGEVFEYLHGHEIVALVVDGAFHSAPLSASWIDREPVFLPDRSAGGRLVFDVPAGSTPTELWLAFTGLKFDGEDEIRYPRSLALPLTDVEVSRAAAASRLDDHPIRAELLSGTSEGGELRLRLALVNEGSGAGFVEPRARFALDVGGAARLTHDAAATSGAPHPAPERIWLDPGRAYAFDLVFGLPADASAGALVFYGVKREVALPLGWESGDVGAATAPSAASASAAPAAAPDRDREAPESTEPRESTEPTEPTREPTEPTSAPRQPQGLAGVGLTGVQVNLAIDRGAEFLWAHVVEEELRGNLNSFGNVAEHWLAAFALVHAGYHERDPEFAAALQAAWPRAERQLASTYANAVICMLIDALGDEELRPLLTRAARHLVEGQKENGSWNYQCRLPEDTSAADSAPPSFVTVSQTGSEDLTRVGPWPEKAANGDNSVTQFAILGLRVAERWSLDVPDEVWARAETIYESRVGNDGGWSYRKGLSYGSMTCAGICSIAVARWAQGEEFGAESEHIAGALGWLDERFRTDGNPKNSRYHYYYLYSLERVGQLLGVDFVGEHEWYPLGARFLVDAQRADGSWEERTEIVQPTSFALLFLTRATESLEETIEAPTTGRLVTSVETVDPAPVYFIFDASGSMRSKLGERSKLDLARDALNQIGSELTEGTPVALRVYGHRKAAIEPGADEDTELVLPLEPWSAGSAARLEATLAGLRPRGKTPLAASLDATLADLRGRRATVVLLTDGGEETRARRNPIEAARPFGESDKLSLVIVGLDIGKERWTEQLRGMADAARGTYLAVGASERLAATLRSALLSLPEEIVLLDGDGAVHDRFPAPDQRQLAPGNYQLAFEVASRPFLVPVTIEAGGVTRVHLDPGHFHPEGE